jgi:hypothetical protein
VPLLARFRERGEYPELAREVADEKTPIRYRWVGLLALYRSGEDVSAKQVAGLMRKDTTIDGRVTGLAFLAELDSLADVRQDLVDMLDDPYQAVRHAAIATLKRHPVATALPRMDKMLYDRSYDDSQILDAVAAIDTPESREALAKLLERCLATEAEKHRISYVLAAFETAIGRHTLAAGLEDDAVYRQKAEATLEWWKKEKKKKER